MSHPASTPRTLLGFVAMTVLAMAGCAQPIPDGAGLAQVPVFEGAPAQPRPMPAKDVIPHPILGVDSVFHEDHYNSDVSDFPGPLGLDPKVRSRFYGACSSLMLDSAGRLIVSCQNPQPPGRILRLLDPDTLETLASTPIATAASTGGSVGGGNYPHVTRDDRVITGSPENHFDEFAIVEADGAFSFEKTSRFDLSSFIPPGDVIFDIAPAFDGTLWFVTTLGTVGAFDEASGTAYTVPLAGERVENGFAIGEDGAYVLTDAALYGFERDPTTGVPVAAWREAYDVDPEPKPGIFSDGSGTTPTLLGRELIAIVDNAINQVNLRVYRRSHAFAGDRLVCSVPLFEPGASGSDVSVIGNGRSIVAANFFGAPPELVLPNGQTRPGLVGDNRALAPGLTRVDVRSDLGGCDVTWTLDLASTSVPKLSTATGLIYTYTQRIDETTEAATPPIDAWYLTAVDFETGERVWDLLMGTGPYHHNGFLMPTIGTRGAVYHGNLGGVVRVADGADPDGWLSRARFFGMRFSRLFRRSWERKSRSYSLDSVREEETLITDCDQRTLVSSLLSLARKGPSLCNLDGKPGSP